MSAPTLELDGLTVTYPDFRLGPLDLSLDRGERVALLGANGAGKSTTLAALGGRLPRWRGVVRWEGRDLRCLLPGIRARVGYLPERLLGFGWMTVEEHLRFLASFYPTWDRDYEAELTGRLGLRRSAKVGTLSRGTKVRLAFVCAEAYRPPVLLLDEPTSGIDPVMRGDLLELLLECVPAGGDRLLLFSSHVLEDVTRICERILVLEGGRLVADRERSELRSAFPDRPLVDILQSELSRRE